MAQHTVLNLEQFADLGKRRAPMTDIGNLKHRTRNVAANKTVEIARLDSENEPPSLPKRPLDGDSSTSWNKIDPGQGRKRQKREGKRQLQQSSVEKISQDIDIVCCPSNCLASLPFASICESRETFWKLVTSDQNEQICDHRSSVLPDQEKCVLLGQLVCTECWRIVHGVSKSRYYVLKGKTSPGKDAISSQKYDRPRTADVVNYIRSSARAHGEVQPNSGNVMLPTCYSIHNTYEDYASGHSNPYCLKHFKRLVNDRFPEIKASERTTFTECKECSMIRNAKGGNLTKEQLLLLEEQKRAHLLVQRLAREKYYKHIKKARNNPQKYCSIIIDNMDQAKTNLPRLPSYHKGDVSLTRIHHHVTGILAHGQGKSYVFTWTDKFSCDSNITMNCLLRVFDDIAQQGRLPPTLYLQADNSAKDNKNFIMMGFLGSLVLRKIFKKVKLSFLMVGHTHEDVDQMFSRISIHIGKMAIKTLDTLHEEIQAAYHPQPTTEYMNDLWDYRALALQSPIQLSGHKSPHCFKFHLQEDRVIMSYKEWPLQRAAFQQLDITELARAFDTSPLPINTMPEKGRGAFNAMTTDLPKWKRCGSLSEEETSWWETHLENQHRYGQPTVPKLEEFGHSLTSTTDVANTMSTEIGDTIRRHVSALTQESTIRTVRQRRRAVVS